MTHNGGNGGISKTYEIPILTHELCDFLPVKFPWEYHNTIRVWRTRIWALSYGRTGN